MTQGILVARSRPSSPERLDEFQRWYDEVHIPELMAVEGFRSAARYVAVDGASYLTAYEVDDVEQAKASLADARAAGRISPPRGVQLDPPPDARWFEQLVPR